MDHIFCLLILYRRIIPQELISAIPRVEKSMKNLFLGNPEDVPSKIKMQIRNKQEWSKYSGNLNFTERRPKPAIINIIATPIDSSNFLLNPENASSKAIVQKKILLLIHNQFFPSACRTFSFFPFASKSLYISRSLVPDKKLVSTGNPF